jgi:hypothetical protein
MLKTPNGVGLTLCQQLVVENKTHNVVLMKTFDRLGFATFPSPPGRIVLYAMLTDGLGDATMSVAVTRLDTLRG